MDMRSLGGCLIPGDGLFYSQYIIRIFEWLHLSGCMTEWSGVNVRVGLYVRACVCVCVCITVFDYANYSAYYIIIKTVIVGFFYLINSFSC